MHSITFFESFKSCLRVLKLWICVLRHWERFLTLVPKISAHIDGGRAEGLACADPGALTPIGVKEIFSFIIQFRELCIQFWELCIQCWEICIQFWDIFIQFWEICIQFWVLSLKALKEKDIETQILLEMLNEIEKKFESFELLQKNYDATEIKLKIFGEKHKWNKLRNYSNAQIMILKQSLKIAYKFGWKWSIPLWRKKSIQELANYYIKNLKKHLYLIPI